MMKPHVDNLWLIALSSKCKWISPSNAIILAFVFFLSWLILNLIFWAHPGGPAWGRLRWTRLSPRARVIPGPRGVPVVGSMGLMAGLAHRRLASAAESCGAKRLMAFSLGQTRAVVTCDPDVARDILNGSAFVDRPAKESAYELMFGRSMGFAPYGVYWTTLRRIASAHLFCPKQLKASAQHRLEIANQVAAILECSGRDGGGGGGGCDIRVRDVLKLASLNNMMYSVFGRRYVLDPNNSETAELRDLVEEGYHLLGQLNWSDHFSFLADFDVQNIRSRCARMVPRVNRIVGGIMAEHKDRTDGRDFVDVLQSLQGPDRLSESDMISLLWEMIFRGTDTVAVLMEWILARLVLHRDVQSRVQHELDGVVGRSRAVTESDLAELGYLTAVVKEVLRLHPPGPLLSWSRLSIRDTTVGGHRVPAGTTAMVNMWAIARDPDYWPDPLSFKPERFLAGGPEITDLRLAPFGSGRRSCPGKGMGMTAVSFWVARLLHEFEFAAAAAAGGVDLSEELRLSCEMKQPLMVRVRRRIDSFAH
ncbi:cytochrome P450 78A9-like [Salvia miltiorrhiza]|uniref:cytochrome P450 78A9-like n=1 Tax=Salvia miltiorrhiza TaxID=226208 RepID=UPI0025ABE628|nr:cytochrome P450 78A9-like [Salvia miltiorrhiza]